ncbi:MAG: InlB B-repeat-containing protein [Peptostreptococcaceae bacterium]|nr:InlB B-repeat-containing protein [Peptostreptococcaceae bacterium]
MLSKKRLLSLLMAFIMTVTAVPFAQLEVFADDSSNQESVIENASAVVSNETVNDDSQNQKEHDDKIAKEIDQKIDARLLSEIRLFSYKKDYMLSHSLINDYVTTVYLKEGVDRIKLMLKPAHPNQIVDVQLNGKYIDEKTSYDDVYITIEEDDLNHETLKYDIEVAIYNQKEDDLVIKYELNVVPFVNNSDEGSNPDLSQNKYRVTFDSNGGSEVSEQLVEHDKQAVQPDSPSKEGYKFIGWELDGKLFDFGMKITKDIQLKAVWEVNQYKVLFDTDGGSTVSEQNIPFNKEAERPANPTKEGYEFIGWFDEQGQKFDFNKKIQSDIKLTAKWRVNQYKVLFNSDGGSGVFDQFVNFGQKAKRPANPTKEGYKFVGWFDEQGKEFDFEKSIQNDVRLTAKWSANQHKVLFDSNGGSIVFDQLVYYNQKAKSPANPTKKGYIFVGWFDEQDKKFDFEKVIQSDVKLTAKWEKEPYTVTFKHKDKVLATQKVKEGEFATAIPLPKSEDRTFDFVYWREETGVKINFDFTKPITKNIVLVPHLKHRVVEVTIDFNDEGKTKNKVNYMMAGHVYDNQEKQPSREGYIFKGWYKGEALYEFGKTKEYENFTLTAQWEIVKHTVTFNTGSEEVIAPIKVVHGQKLELPTLNAAKKPGFKFIGWFTDGSFVNAWDKDQVVTADITVHAKWVPVRYTVTFNTNSEEKIEAKKVVHGQKLELPTLDAAKKPGFKFIGWFTDGSFVNAWDKDQVVTADITVHAKWVPVRYTVTFNTNSEEKIAPIKAVHGQKLELPTLNAAKKPGFKFIGWFTDGSFVNAWDKEQVVTADITVHAKWVPVRYTVTFNTNSEEKIEAKKVVHGQKLELPTLDAAKKPGFKFIGWFTDGSFVNAWNKEQTVTADIELHAKWVPVRYTVTFNTNSEEKIEAKKVVHGQKLELPTLNADKKPGFKFIGWFTDGSFVNAWDKDQVVTGNAELYAKWVPLTYTVSFVTNSEQYVESINVAYGQKIELPELDPNGKPWYIFIGWFADNNFENEWTEDTVVKGDITLYAKWEIVKHTITFKTNSNKTISPVEVNHNEGFNPPILDSKDKPGYKFVGWFTDEKFVNEWTADTVVKGNVILYAKWEAVTVNNSSSGGGSGSFFSTSSNNNNETVINDNQTPLASVEDNVIAKLHIGSKIYSVKENDTFIEKTMDTTPILRESRTLIPVRATSEIFDVKVNFDDKNKEAEFIFVDQNKKENVIVMKLGQKNMMVNGESRVLSTDIMTINNRVMLPISDVKNALRELGLHVDIQWDNVLKEVTVLKTAE